MIVQEILLRIFEFSSYLYHSQTTAMAMMALLAEVPEWQWCYDPALDSLLLLATSHICLYIFIQHVFTISILSPLSTRKLRLIGPHYTRLIQLLYHLSPLLQLLKRVNP